MILYKNVDICDLESILQNGILSIDECGNDNWDEGKRASNSTSVVYLFKPTGRINSFPGYGTALIECDCEAAENTMGDADVHKKDYTEYVCDKVLPSQIKNIYIPKIFRNSVNVPDSAKIEWCEMKANHYGDAGLEEASEEILEQFGKTACVENSSIPNYFRGTYPNSREVMDLYDIVYVI